MTPTGIQITDMTTKWGLVTVANPDSSINRQYTISAEDAQIVATGNNILPPGVTAEEWHGGWAVMSGRPCNIGNGVVNPDGSLIVNYGVQKVAGKINVSLMLIPPHEWELVDGIVHIVPDVAAQVDVPFELVHKG
jgi:hypothetical protein